MSIAEKLELLISMDPSQATAAVRKLSGEVESEASKMQSRLASIGSGLMGAGAGGLAAGALLTQLGSQEQAAAQQLDAAITQVGQSVDEFTGRIDNAKDHATQYGITAHEVDNALATLTLSFGDTGKALDNLQLVEDLAAKKHIALADAATMVAKAHGGTARLFKEFGIQVQQNADGTKDYDGALTQLAQKLQGQASAASDTFMGKVHALAATVENAAASFGEKYGPAILGVSAALTAVGGIMSTTSHILETLAARHAAAALAAEEQAAAEESANLAMVPIIGTVALLTAGMAYGIANAQSFSYNLKQMGDFSDISKESLAKFSYVVGQGNTNLYDIGKTLAQQSIPQTLAYADALDRNGISSADVRRAVADQIQEQKNLDAEQKKAEQSTEDYTAALKRLDDQLHAEVDPLFGLVSAMESNKKAQDDAAAATAQYGADSQQAADANLRVAETALQVQDAALKLASGIQSGKVSLDAAKAALNQWVVAGLISRQQADQLAASFAIAAAQANSLAANAYNAAAGLDAANAAAEKFAPGTYDAQGNYHRSNVRRNAAGTDWFEGGLTWVGEQGPELVNLPRGSAVINNSNAKALAESSGGGQTNHFHITTPDPIESAAEAVRRLRAEAMLSAA